MFWNTLRLLVVRRSDNNRNRGSKIPKEECEESLERIRIFKEWFDKEIWRLDEPDNAAIMIVPQGRPGANYRDTQAEPA